MSILGIACINALSLRYWLYCTRCVISLDGMWHESYIQRYTMKNKNPIIGILLIVFAVFMSASAAADEKKHLESPTSIQAIVNRGKLVVAMYSQDVPPFYYVDKNNQLTGLDIVLIKGFANLLGVSVEFDRNAQFIDDVIDKVEKHEADMAICKLSLTFNRAKRVLFSNPYINLHQSLLVNRLELSKQLKGRPQEEVIQNLTGKIGVIAKSSYAGYAKYFKNMEIVMYPSWNGVLDDLLAGQLTAAFRDEAEVKLVVKERPDVALKLLSVVLKDTYDPKGIAVSFDHQELKELLNFYLTSLDLNLNADRVVNDYDNLIGMIENKIKQRFYNE